MKFYCRAKGGSSGRNQRKDIRKQERKLKRNENANVQMERIGVSRSVGCERAALSSLNWSACLFLRSERLSVSPFSLALVLIGHFQISAGLVSPAADCTDEIQYDCRRGKG